MMPGMLAVILLLAGVAAQNWVLDPGLPSRLSEKDLQRGKALYAAHCQSCHGVDGDDTRIEGITPLGGLSLRLGDPRNRNFGGPSFRARGRVYPPDEAQALMGYILTLPGEKGFRRPEALISPHLLDRKKARRTYLIVDVRSETDFKRGHISNTVNLPPKELAAFARPSLAPDLRNRIVILYDAGTGLQAARVWRDVYQSGHRSVAVLDGGFKRWVAEDREISTGTPAAPRPNLLVNAPAPQKAAMAKDQSAAALVEFRVDWRKTVTAGGLRRASEINDYLRSAGLKGPGHYRLAAGSECADLLAFQLHLLGYSVDRPTPDRLWLR